MDFPVTMQHGSFATADYAPESRRGTIGPRFQVLEGLAEGLCERPVAVHCAGGYRSWIETSIVRRCGITKRSEMAGGLDA